MEPASRLQPAKAPGAEKRSRRTGLFGLAAMQLMATAAWAVALLRDPLAGTSTVGGVLYHIPHTLAAAQHWHVAHTGPRSQRLPWVLLAVSIPLLALGDVFHLHADLTGGLAASVVAVAIAFVSHGALGAGVLVLLNRRGHRLSAGRPVDALVVACAVGASGLVLWEALATETTLANGAIHLLPGLIGLAVTLLAAHAVAVGGWRDRVLVLLLAALVLRGFGAVVHDAAGVEGTAAAVSRVAWLAFAALAAAAALTERSAGAAGTWRAAPALPRVSGDWLVIASCMSVAVGVLVYAQFRSQPPVVTALAVAALIGATARAARSDREAQRLDEAEQELRVDELTGLLNRRGFTEEVTRTAGQGAGALLVLNIDRFREVNDLLGHDSGDEVLGKLAKRLERAVRAGDVLARMSGDEFGVLSQESSAREATDLAHRLQALVETPVSVGGSVVRVNASVGLTVWHDPDPEGARLLAQASQALNRAKQRRSGVERYDSERDAAGARRLALTDALRRSISRHELMLHYQPKVDIRTGEVVGVEALARWWNDGIAVPPDVFISMAEEGGLIAELTRDLLDQALEQARAWAEEGIQLVVAVNLSPRNLLDPNLPERVEVLLAKHGVSPRQLMLEITETTLIPDHIRTSKVLADLRAVGVRLSIDDYGTGHAALAYLRDFPVDELKLDRSYVTGMVDDVRTAAIVRSTVEMGRQLGLTVVAEGVERDEELDAVARAGCEVVQGYLMCRPMAGEDVTSWLRSR